jgi:hypothetical protein
MLLIAGAIRAESNPIMAITVSNSTRLKPNLEALLPAPLRKAQKSAMCASGSTSPERDALAPSILVILAIEHIRANLRSA